MEWADALGQLAQPFCHRTIFRPFAFRGRWVDLRGADGVGRPARAGGWPLATKRSDSSAERRICALGDQSALVGHLSPRGSAPSPHHAPAAGSASPHPTQRRTPCSRRPAPRTTELRWAALWPEGLPTACGGGRAPAKPTQAGTDGSAGALCHARASCCCVGGGGVDRHGSARITRACS